MRTFKIIVVCGSLLFLAGFLSAAYILFLRPLTLPVYQFEQKMSEHGDFMASTLTRGDTTYISDYTEFPLEMKASWAGKNRMIGRTQDGLDIYAIPQQEPRDYIMMTTEMFPLVIFRNNNVARMEGSSFPVDEIQIIAPPGIHPSRYKTREPAIIQEVEETLLHREGTLKGGQAAQSANMYLNSEQLPGLGYAVYVNINGDGKVFLAERLAPDDWIPAGPEFSRWFKNAAE